MTLSKCAEAGVNLEHGLCEVEESMMELSPAEKFVLHPAGVLKVIQESVFHSSSQQIVSTSLVPSAVNTKDKNLYLYGAHILVGSNRQCAK